MDTKRVCPSCGKPVESNAPQGLCPECLMKGAFPTGTDTGGKPISFVPPKVEELAAKFPQLDILEFIGQGGMGAVYKARQKQLDRIVALKILPPQAAGGPGFAERFAREARALAKLNHPHIVTLYEFGQADGLFYFLMEFVDGTNLRHVLKAGRIAPKEALAIVPQICEALQFAHENGIVHRDIKPENILLSRGGQVKIADFGVAKIVAEGMTETAAAAAPPGELTEAGSAIGTPQYMAPEQVEKPREVDHRADIYSLGVVFYEMLTGELPLGKFELPSQRARLDVRLDEVVLRSLERSPERRYQNVSEVKTQVETIATSAAQPKAPAANAVAGATLPRFQAIAFTAASVLMALLLLFVGWAANQMGAFFNVLFVFILLMVPVRILLILWQTFHGTLEYRLWRKPLAPELAKYRWRVINRWIFWLLAAVVLQICVVPAQFTSEQLSFIRVVTFGGVAVLILLELLPARRLYLATNAVYAAGSVFMAVQIARIYWPESKAQAVVLSMPVRGDWLVVNGGNSSLINIHYPFKEQRNAVDMEKLADGHERTGDAHKLESYPSWGETVYAPADGKIAVAQGNLDDNVVGEMDRDNPVGNHICIDMGDGRYIMLAHLQKGSLEVSEGDTVHLGQPLAKCGNSGNTSHPHLHIQVQDAPRIFVTGKGDATTFPILFRDATRVRAKQSVGGAPFFVRRNDQIIGSEPAFAIESWAPTLAPGEKPDLRKILEEANEFMRRDSFEESLKRYVWFYDHEPEYGDPYQDTVRITSALSDWGELAQRYPRARQALVAIRDRDMREFARGRGYSELFQEIQSINRALKDEDTTYLLFKAIRKGDPKLAEGCFFFVEGQLIARGQYQWCYEYLGDPHFQLSLVRQSFEMQTANQKRAAESRQQSMERMAEFYRERGLTNSAPYPPPDTSAMMLQSATNSFVGSVSSLIEVLIGTGDEAEAGKIQGEALLVLDDPRLKSALSDAQERVEKRRALPASDSSSPTNFTVLPLAKSETGIGADANSSAETWSPVLQPGAKPDLNQILQDANELMSKHHYEEALQRHIWYHNHSKSDPGQAGVRNSFALADWVELARRYPKAKQALMDIRDGDERKLSAGHGSADLFLDLQSINNYSGDDDSTYALFKRLDRGDKKLAQECFSFAESLLVEKHEFNLCLDYTGKPQSAFESIRSSRERMKDWEDRQEEQREQSAERFQAMAKTNSAFASMPSFPPLPKSADKNFIGQTCQLIEILVGANRKSDAEQIRDEALAVLNDDRIASAIADAEQRIQTTSSNGSNLPNLEQQVLLTEAERMKATNAAQAPLPALAPPDLMPAAPAAQIIRPLRTLPSRSTTPLTEPGMPASLSNEISLTPEQQVLLIEAERMKALKDGDPISQLLPSRNSAPLPIETNSTMPPDGGDTMSAKSSEMELASVTDDSSRWKPIPAESAVLDEKLRAFAESYLSTHDMRDTNTRIEFGKLQRPYIEKIDESLKSTMAEPLVNEHRELSKEVEAASKAGEIDRVTAVGQELGPIGIEIERMIKGMPIGQFRWVATNGDVNSPVDIVTSRDGEKALRLLKQVALDEHEVKSAGFTGFNPDKKDLSVYLYPSAGKRFLAEVPKHFGQSVAVVWQGRVVAELNVSEYSEEHVVLSGDLSDADSQEVLDILNRQMQTNPGRAISTRSHREPASSTNK